MSISIRCPRCDRELKAPDELAGKKAKCPGCGQTLVLSPKKNAHGCWTGAVLLECANADAILDHALEEGREAERPLVTAALQALLAHAAASALYCATRQEASSFATVLYEELAAHSELTSSDFRTIWVGVHDLLDREPATVENGESLWARVVFALRDAGCDARHVTDLLWVWYTFMVYPNFKVRVYEAAGGRSMQPRLTPEAAAQAFVKATADFLVEVTTATARALGDIMGDAKKRRLFGAVRVETILRAINAGRTLIGDA
jgi:hypothetical protein